MQKENQNVAAKLILNWEVFTLNSVTSRIYSLSKGSVSPSLSCYIEVLFSLLIECQCGLVHSAAWVTLRTRRLTVRTNEISFQVRRSLIPMLIPCGDNCTCTSLNLLGIYFQSLEEISSPLPRVVFLNFPKERTLTSLWGKVKHPGRSFRRQAFGMSRKSCVDASSSITFALHWNTITKSADQLACRCPHSKLTCVVCSIMSLHMAANWERFDACGG